MRHMSCNRIDVKSGGKSVVIQKMINDKLLLKANEEKKQEVKNNKTIQLEIEKYKDLKHKAEDQAAKLKKLATTINCEFVEDWHYLDNDKRTYEYRMKPKLKDCYVPAKVLNDLQRASDFFALNDRKGAQQIWDKIIEEYKLKE